MTDLEERARSVLPTTPPSAVIYAFQFGASVSDVLELAGLSGPALARAKIYLPQIRRAAIQIEYHPDSETLASIKEVLAHAVPTSIAEEGLQKFAVFRPQLAENKHAIADLQLDQLANVDRLRRINDRITRATTSSAMGKRSLRNLALEHDTCTADISCNFQHLLKLADERSRILVKATMFIDSVLLVAGCNVSGVHSAGGTDRTVRTVYKRGAHLGRLRSRHFPEELVVACKQLLGRLARYEHAVLDFRRSVKADLELLGGRSGTIRLSPTSSQGYAWASDYWSQGN